MARVSEPRGHPPALDDGVGSAEPDGPEESRLRPFLRVVAVGMLGILAFLPGLWPMLAGRAAGLPAEAASLIALLQVALAFALGPLVLVGLAAWAGVLFAPRVGSRSWLARWPTDATASREGLSRELLQALGLGLLVPVLLFAIGLALTALLGLALRSPTAFEATAEAGSLLFALFVATTWQVLRWGLLLLAVHLGWRVLQRRRDAPGPSIWWSAILLLAAYEGFGGLRGVQASGTLTAQTAVMQVLLVGGLGVLLGWLQWRRSLEAAMVAAGAATGMAVLASWAFSVLAS